MQYVSENKKMWRIFSHFLVLVISEFHIKQEPKWSLVRRYTYRQIHFTSKKTENFHDVFLSVRLSHRTPPVYWKKLTRLRKFVFRRFKITPDKHAINNIVTRQPAALTCTPAGRSMFQTATSLKVKDGRTDRQNPISISHTLRGFVMLSADVRHY